MLCLALQRSSGSCGTQVDADAGGSVNDTQGDVGVGPLSTGEPVDEAPENDKRRTMKTVREVRTDPESGRRPSGPAARGDSGERNIGAHQESCRDAPLKIRPGAAVVSTRQGRGGRPAHGEP